MTWSPLSLSISGSNKIFLYVSVDWTSRRQWVMRFVTLWTICSIDGIQLAAIALSGEMARFETIEAYNRL